jgi:preprotein translocase subunit SecG
MLFTILIIIGCVGLILFVLVQNPKGGGLNSEFGSAVQLGGAKRATDILEKGTWGLAIVIALICLVTARPSGGASAAEELESDPNAVESPTAPETAPEGAPGGFTVPGGSQPQ